MSRTAIMAMLMAVTLFAASWLMYQELPDFSAVKQISDKEIAAEPIATVPEIKIEEFTLQNGMKVILLPNDRVPAVNHTLWLKVGAADDPTGQSGLAHYHEHLMFKGTPTVAAGQYSQQLEALGADYNAFTGADFTGYYVNIARQHLEKVMQLESDRLQNLAPKPEHYDKELQVIIEERQTRVENRPASQLAEQMQATLFQHHPYRIPIIGWMHEIKGLKPEHARSFYERFYHAGNIVLVVAGDISKEELKPLAERYYGVLPARPAYQRNWVREPQPRAARSVALRHPQVLQPRWQRYYLAPSWVHGQKEHVMPLLLLAQWLGQGKTSALYQALVQDSRLAVDVHASYSGMVAGPGMFSISVTPAKGVAISEIEAGVEDILDQVQAKPVTDKALERMKTMLKADVIYAQDGLQGLAHYVGYLAMLDLPLNYLTEWSDRVDRVSAEEISKAAKAVLLPERSVTGYLLPQNRLQEEQKPQMSEPIPQADKKDDKTGEKDKARANERVGNDSE